MHKFAESWICSSFMISARQNATGLLTKHDLSASFGIRRNFE